MSSFTDLERDLCKRTKSNMDYIMRAKQEKQEVFETTQIFNSLLGIIVNIHQNSIYSEKFESIKIKTIKSEWKIPDVPDIFLSDFLKHLRNAIAHMNVEFDDKQTGEIKRLILQNKDDDHSNTITWECKFPIKYVETFLHRLCEYVENN